MKSFLLIPLFFLTIFPIHAAHADTKTVTINWSTSGAIDEVLSYKMIYSYGSDMADPIDACETNDNSVNSLTCESVEIDSQDVYFRILATTNQPTLTESNVELVTIPISTMSIVQGFILSPPSSPPPPESSANIYDDFSTDTSANYSLISGSIFIENGTAHGQSWKRTLGYHTKSLGTTDQTVSATCYFTDADYSSVAARIDPINQTGYYVSIRSGDLTLHSFSGTSSRWITETSHSFTSPIKLELVIMGDNIVVKINDIVQINTTNTTYSSGNFCGPVISRSMTDADIPLDDFEGTAQ